jgi:hypothetical protein
MFATALRWLKWTLVAWGAVSLCGLAVLFAAITFAEDGPADDAMSKAELVELEREQVEDRLAAAGFSKGALAAVDRSSGYDEWGTVQAKRVHLSAGAWHWHSTVGWHAMGGLPSHVAAALGESCVRLRGAGIDWFPSTAGMSSGHYQVFASNVGFGPTGISSIELMIVDPGTATAYLIRGQGLEPAPWNRFGCGRLQCANCA